MFDLKTRKRDFEQQLFFLLEKSQTSGTKSKFQEIERRKVTRPRDRRAQRDLFDIFAFRKLTHSLFSSSSLDAEKPKNTHLLLFLSQNAIDTKTKRKEKKRSVRAQKRIEVFVFRDRSADAVGTISVNERKALFSSSSLDFRERAFFSRRPPPRETKNETHTKRKEKTRTPKNTPPFLKMSQHDATKKVEKLFFCSFFLR